MIRVLAFALALAVAAPVVHAQPAPGAAENRRERIKKKIRALRAYTLTEELSLDEVTAGKLFPVLAKYDDVLDKLLQARADLERRLKNADAIKDPRAVVKPGDIVKVKVLEVDKQRKRVALSMRLDDRENARPARAPAGQPMSRDRSREKPAASGGGALADALARAMRGEGPAPR